MIHSTGSILILLPHSQPKLIIIIITNHYTVFIFSLFFSFLFFRSQFSYTQCVSYSERRHRQAVDEMTVRAAYSDALKVQLYTQFFKKVNSWFVEALKLVCIGSTISHGYDGTRFGHSNLFISFFCAFIHISCSVAYCGVFRRAHRLGEMQRALKNKLRMSCTSYARHSFRQEMLKATRALSCKGMRVGSFHEMERNSTLIFMDFVER